MPKSEMIPYEKGEHPLHDNFFNLLLHEVSAFKEAGGRNAVAIVEPYQKGSLFNCLTIAHNEEENAEVIAVSDLVNNGVSVKGTAMYCSQLSESGVKYAIRMGVSSIIALYDVSDYDSEGLALAENLMEYADQSNVSLLIYRTWNNREADEKAHAEQEWAELEKAAKEGKKYILYKKEMEYGISNERWRIRACRDIETTEMFGNREVKKLLVPKGTLGGLVQSEKNLSQKGNCWISSGACVIDDAEVSENAIVCGKAGVRRNAKVKGNAVVSDSAEITDESVVSENARVSGEALVYGKSRIEGSSRVKDKAKVKGTHVKGNALICGNANAECLLVCDNAEIRDDAVVYGDVQLFDFATVYGNAIVCGKTILHEYASVFDNAQVRGGSVYGHAKIYENAVLLPEVVELGMMSLNGVGGNAMIHGDCCLWGVYIVDDVEVKGHAFVGGDVQLRGNVIIGSYASVYDHVSVSGQARITGMAHVHEFATVCDNAKIGGTTEILGIEVGGDVFLEERHTYDRLNKEEVYWKKHEDTGKPYPSVTSRTLTLKEEMIKTLLPTLNAKQVEHVEIQK